MIIVCLLVIQGVLNAQVNPVVKYMPEKAGMILTINPTRMGSKIPPETFRQSFMYRALMKNPDPEVLQMMANPTASTGIDFKSDFIVVFDKEEAPAAGEEDEMPMGNKSGIGAFHVMGQIKNESVFAELLKKLPGADSLIQTFGNNKIYQFGEGAMSLCWNNEIFSMNAGMSAAAKKQLMAFVMDTTNGEMDNKMANMKFEMMKMQRQVCFDILTPRPNNSYSQNPAFIAWLNEPADMRTWGKGFMSPVANKFLAGLDKSLTSLFNRERSATVNFDAGKIVMTSRTTMDPSVVELYTRHKSPEVNPALISRLPEGNIMFQMQFAMNPEAAKEAMNNPMLKAMMDSLKTKIPFDFSGMSSIFKGDMMFAVIRPDKVNPDDNATQKMEGIQIIAAMSIADPVKFEEFKNNIKEFMAQMNKGMNGEAGEGNEGKNPFKGFKPATGTKGDLFVISNSSFAVDEFLNSPGLRAFPSVFPNGETYPMSMSLNLKEIFNMAFMKGRKKNDGEGKDDPEMLEALGKLKQLVMYGGKMENGQMKNTVEFQFSDPGKNSMLQLFEIMNLAIQSSEKNKKNRIIEDDGVKEEAKEDAPVIREVTIEGVKDETAPPPPPPPPPPAEAKKKPVVKKTKN